MPSPHLSRRRLALCLALSSLGSPGCRDLGQALGSLGSFGGGRGSAARRPGAPGSPLGPAPLPQPPTRDPRGSVGGSSRGGSGAGLPGLDGRGAPDPTGVVFAVKGTAFEPQRLAGNVDPNGNGYLEASEVGVALPDRSALGRRVYVRYRGQTTPQPVVVLDVGPWNTKDPYWETGGTPQAESGTDMRGRSTNRAGIDLTWALVRALDPQGASKDPSDYANWSSGPGEVEWWFADAGGPA